MVPSLINSRNTQPRGAILSTSAKFLQNFAAITGLPPLVVVVAACAPQWCCQTDWTPDRDWVGSVFRAGSPGSFQKERPRGYYLPEPTLEGVLLRQELPNGDSSDAGQRVRRSQLVNGPWRLDSSCIELLDVCLGWFGRLLQRVWTALGRSRKGVVVMPEPQPTRCLLHKVEAFGVSATGDPYADVTLIHPQGKTLSAQAFSSCFGDLNQLHAFEGGEVNVQVTPTGLQLRPIAEQVIPDPDASVDSGRDQGLLEDRSVLDPDSVFFPSETDLIGAPSLMGTCTTPTIQEVAATVARLARDFGLPTVVWVHLPNSA